MSKLLLLASIWSLTGAHELLLARNAQITARAVFEPMGPAGVLKRQASSCYSSNYTPCPDGSGCCPGGAACFQSNGVGLCSVICSANQPQCVFNGVSACCGIGEACGGSVCVPASTGTPAASITTSPTTTTTPSVAAVATSATPVSSSAINTSGLTTVPIPTTYFPLPTSSSSSAAFAGCKSLSTYCTWPATILTNSNATVTLAATSGCCAGGCNPTSPGVCLPTTITSTSIVAGGTGGSTKTTAAIATVVSASANRMLIENSWALGLIGLLFGL